MKFRILLSAITGAVILATSSTAQILISATDTSYTETFSIGATATAALPAGWKIDKNTTARSVGTYAGAGTATEREGSTSLSSSAANGIYNFGATADSTDRAVGFLSSSSATKSGNLYAQFQNNTGSTITSFTISYDVEKYRGGTNPSGFSIQMYYSTDGTSWTSAGSNYLTSFAADASNNGFNPAPGVTTSVTASGLSLSIAQGSSLYLAWNYAVTSGSTTSNAQALSLDNISLTAHAIPEPSTYAAIFGALALAGVCVHRRRQARR